MIEGATRAKGLHSLAKELGFVDLANVVKLGTDSSAAKSFVSRRGLGKMRHLEIRDLWLQQQVRDRLVEVSKVPGERNPANLMTKILPITDIRIRVADLGMELVEDAACIGACKSKSLCCVSVRERESRMPDGLVDAERGAETPREQARRSHNELRWRFHRAETTLMVRGLISTVSLRTLHLCSLALGL